MLSYTPVSRISDCGDGYGLAWVQDEAGAQSRVRVDVNREDSTPNPRIIFAAGQPGERSENVDAAFVSAYEAMTSNESQPVDEKERMCGELRPAEAATPDPVSGWWIALPTVTRVGSYGLRRVFFGNIVNDLRVASPDGGMTALVDGAFIGLDGVTTISYNYTVPRMSDRMFYLSNGGLLLWGGVMCGVAFGAGGNTHGPELHECVGAPLDIASSMGYRYLHGYGSFVDLGLGGLAIGLGFALPANSRVTESDVVYQGNLPPGSRGVEGNPLEAHRFPASRIDLFGLGGVHIANALVTGLYWWTTGSPPPPSVPRLSFAPIPGDGAAVVLGGTF